MSVSQSDFVRAILDPDVAAPEGLVTPKGEPAEKRFNVYRNNVAVSLTEALEATFPLLVKSLGEDFFKAMASAFLRSHPPDSPLLMLYGDKMPGFLESFQPVQKYPYLADLARLELALVQSYHAADSLSVDPDSFGSIPPEQLMESTLSLAPSVHLIRSSWPIYQLWLFNTSPDAPKPQPAAEDIVVVRAEFDPIPRLLPSGGGAFIDALLRGESLNGAAEHAANDDKDHNLALTLSILLEGNAITALTKGNT